MVFGLVLVGTATGLFYAVVDWRAARAWAGCQRALRSRGEVLDFSTLEGPPVPPARNLALLPFFTRWGTYRVDTETGRAVFLAGPPTTYFENLPHLRTDTIHDFPGTQNFDLTAWQHYFQRGTADAATADPAQGVLRALESMRPILDALSAAREAMPDGEFHREHGASDMGYGSYGIRCALARYALAHGGSYPRALDELAPRYLDHLPVGIVDGAPIRYQVTADGHYQLGTMLPKQK